MKSNTEVRIKNVFLATLAIGLAVTTGCKTMSPAGMEAFSTGATAAKTQSEEAFRAVNELIAEDQLEDAAAATNLTEELFSPVLSADNVAIWDQTLSKLESYGQHLQALTSPELTKSFEDQAQVLGADLQHLGQRLQDSGFVGKAPEISPGLATAVTELGRIILRVKAQHDARRTAVSANPEIGSALRVMADSLGETQLTGLRGTVRAHWLGRLGRKKLEFRRETDAEGKHRVAVDFVELMQRRDAQDAVLASLRRSLLGLADLHNALAQGQSLSAHQLAQSIEEEVKAARQTYARFQEQLGNSSL
jgi:hypothetical protein